MGRHRSLQVWPNALLLHAVGVFAARRTSGIPKQSSETRREWQVMKRGSSSVNHVCTFKFIVIVRTARPNTDFVIGILVGHPAGAFVVGFFFKVK